MNDEQLKAIWQTSNERLQHINLHAIKMNKMNEQIKKFEKNITKRNNLETIVAIGLIALFGIYAYIKPTMFAKIGAIMTMLYCLNVIYQLRKTEAKQPNFDITSSLKEQLLEYQAYVKAEQKLLNTVLYWYLLPTIPCMVFFLVGTGITLLAGFLYFGIFMPLCFALVYYMNQKAVKRKTEPLLTDIAKMLKTLEETN